MVWVLGMTCVGIGALFYLLWTSEWLGNKFSAKVSKIISAIIILGLAATTLWASVRLKEINRQAQSFERQVEGEEYWLKISLLGVGIEEEMIAEIKFNHLLSDATIHLNVKGKTLNIYGSAIRGRGVWDVFCTQHSDGTGDSYDLIEYPEIARAVREEGVCRLPNA